MCSLMLLLALSSGAASMTEERAVELARATLEEELGPDAATSEVVRAIARQWPDSSLGCPAREGRYRPVLVDGYQVTFDVEGRRLEVHVGDGRAVICSDGIRGEKAQRRRRLTLGVRMAKLARHDLASRLQVAEEDIAIGSVRLETWPDASLGCPEPGRAYAPLETRGFLIELEHEGKTYAYHSDEERPLLCEDESP